MANAKITVELSREDRALLRDIRDTLRAAGVKPEDEQQAADTARRLIEGGVFRCSFV